MFFKKNSDSGSTPAGTVPEKKAMTTRALKWFPSTGKDKRNSKPVVVSSDATTTEITSIVVSDYVPSSATTAPPVVDETTRIYQDLGRVVGDAIIRIAAQYSLPVDQDYSNFDEHSLAFFGQSLPSISLAMYLARFTRYVNAFYGEQNVENSSGLRLVLLAAIYVQRLFTEGFKLHIMNIHRVFLPALVVAAKYSEDGHPGAGFMARVGGVSQPELNILEERFAVESKFNFIVTLEQYCEWRRALGLPEDV